ncbi:MAG: hypothetical protein HY889_00080 [Deltaproteobacteria bacterium]|nr:hypothetical protein [Deltaproteobacteria bacterium]
MKIKDLKDGIREDKGFILILALVTMLAMTLIGLSVVMNMTTDMQLARNDREAKLAFQLAEAGLREASARLHLTSTKAKYIGEKSTDAGYRTTAWNANNSLGRNFGSGMAGAAASVDNLNYTVTINYLTEDNPEGFCDSNNVANNDAGNASVPPAACAKNPPEIVMYGQDFNLNSAVSYIKYGTLPVYKLTSTGTSNGTSRTVVAYLGESNLNTDTTFAINTNSCIGVSGGSNTITGSVQQGAGCACDPQLNGGCSPNKTAPIDMQTYLGDSLANIQTYADQVHSCTTATCNGAGNDIPASGQLDGVVTNWKGTGPQEGVLLYINNSGGKEVSITGNVDGEGILIVTGDLKISGTVKWEGLIYVLGTLTVSGSVNIEGGIMANQAVTLNGSVTAKYELDELQEMARQTSSSATMVWKRL